MKPIKSILSAGLLLLAGGTASAMEILPDSYTFDRATDTGTYQYHDWTGRQLIDGAYGVAPWTADLGNGPAYEWLGWVFDPIVNIDFDFGGATRVTEVHVGSVQDNLTDVVLPDIYLFSSIDATTWDLVDSIIVPESNDNNDSYRTYVFDGLDVTAPYFRVSARHNVNGPWTFIDEVDFYTEKMGKVPAPAPLFMIGLGLAGLAFRARMRQF